MANALTLRSDLAHARRLVFAHGRNATCYQILDPGIRRWVTPDGAGVVGYVPASGVRVVTGAPVCPRERLAEVVAALEDDTSRHGLRACYFGAEEPLAEVLRARGPCDRLVLAGARRPGTGPGPRPRREPPGPTLKSFPPGRHPGVNNPVSDAVERTILAGIPPSSDKRPRPTRESVTGGLIPKRFGRSGRPSSWS